MPSSIFTPQQKDAYRALSDLFLDTEQTQDDLNRLANRLSSTGLSSTALESMLRNDLFPILYPNLISVAGAWDGFQDDWLFTQLQNRQSQSPGVLRGAADWTAWQSVGWIIWKPWTDIKRALQSRL
ncbi:hypothetical protein NM688_g5409 [Phlebia brevispora]|uniref:Uncharacterized protein n=1 Tax=Phlebia brevispora TaxID=194682 RepID=A0ACC1SVU4_9APHY|nr:hypothetical protein NM688_g5409 [Phlebia brevispora]